MTAPADFRRAFLELALDCGCLKFGDFTLKSGRRSPYFFHAAALNTGASLAGVGEIYARALIDSGISFDMLFGPAYKGIPLATTTACALHRLFDRDVPVAFDRKEAKTHGDAGITFGAPLAGRVMILDDVLSSGMTVRHSVELIRASGAEPAGFAILLDRGERGEEDGRSAVQEVEEVFGIPVAAVAHVRDLLAYLDDAPGQTARRDAIEEYLSRYGA